MGDYSFVKDPNGEVVGIWLRELETAEDPFLPMMLFCKHRNLSGEILASIVQKTYRTVPNTHDQGGGCFLMFLPAAAPGEPGWA